ncbi:immunity protein Imm33 domain-containing protein [Sphingomonas sp. MS122]|uniref:immunity protein Imm33 domain-containing protein n=1 Tax=Sphingomonas sp. MS122 TaxID=3412683 RepID=UPI003C2B2339
MGEPDDTYPDSGWRIRGDYRNISDTEVDEREAAYVALGAVLNRDDSWIRLIDEPVGARFIRNWETDAFEPLIDDEDASDAPPVAT